MPVDYNPSALRAGLILVLIALLAACSMPLPLARVAPGPSQLLETTRPAVVIVGAFYSVNWSAPLPTLTTEAARRLQQRAMAEARSGPSGGAPSSLGQAELQLLAQDPGAWFSIGPERHRQTDVVEAQGSGFFVTQGGDLLTNDHVVEMSRTEMEQLLVTGLERQGGDPVALHALQQEVSEALGVVVDGAQAQRLLQWAVRRVGSSLQIDSVTASYRIGFGSQTMRQVESNGEPVQLVRHGAPAPGPDVALLHAPGGPYPTLALAPSVPRQGTTLEVVGYPCRCAQPPTANRTLSPTLSQGHLVGLLPMPGGWEALGTDARIQAGDSGGPVLDDRGRVVGLATFTDSAGEGPGRAFAVPVDVARRLLREAGVDPSQGPIGREYARAVMEFDQRHYRVALPLFQHLVAVEDRHDPYASAYLERSRRAVAAEADRAPPAWTGAAFILLGLLAGLVVVLVLLARHRRLRWVEGEILVERSEEMPPGRSAAPERPALPGETVVDGEAWWE
jgi:S1-C subfamily serine protease